MAITNQSPYAIAVRRESGITKFSDLAGKTIAGTTGEAGLVIFPALLAAQKMPPDSIGFLRVDPNAKMVAILQNQVPAILSGLKTTFKRMFRPNDTLEYPEQRPAIPPGYRGVPTLVKATAP